MVVQGFGLNIRELWQGATHVTGFLSGMGHVHVPQGADVKLAVSGKRPPRRSGAAQTIAAAPIIRRSSTRAHALCALLRSPSSLLTLGI